MKDQNLRYRSRFLFLNIAWLLIVGVNIMQLVLVQWMDPERFSTKDMLLFPILTLSLGVLLIAFWILPGYDFLKPLKLPLKITGFVIHAILYGSIYIFVVFFMLGLWLEEPLPDWYSQEVQKFFVQDFHNVIKNYIYLTAMLFAFDYLKGQDAAIAKQKELENQLLASKLQTVESQLQPHFLFNALNGIVATIDENTQKAQAALLQLSDLLRFSLNFKSNELIPLSDEILLLEKYLAIEKLRHEDQLHVSIEFEQAAPSQFLIPGMILQPLVENAIKHGFKNHRGQLRIEIIINSLNQSISVKNDGTALANPISYNKGLTIVQQRLWYHFPNRHRFSLYQDEQWVVAKIEWYA